VQLVLLWTFHRVPVLCRGYHLLRGCSLLEQNGLHCVIGFYKSLFVLLTIPLSTCVGGWYLRILRYHALGFLEPCFLQITYWIFWYRCRERSSLIRFWRVFEVVGSRSAAAFIARARRSRCDVLSSSWLLRTSLRYFLDDEITALISSALRDECMGMPASLL
jgi:hypothetical protein